MKNILYFFVFLGSSNLFSQTITLDPRSTIPATLQIKGDLTLKRNIFSTSPTTFSTVTRGSNSILQFFGGEIQSISEGADGNIIYVQNIGTSALIIKHQFTTGTTATNRIVTHTGTDVILQNTGESVTLVYDTAIDRWRVMESYNEPWTYFGNGLTNTSNYIGTSDAQPFSLGTNNAKRITVSSNGNVGINTIIPLAKLHVSEGASGVTPPSGTTAIFEDNTTHNIGIHDDGYSSFLSFKKPSNEVKVYDNSIIYNNNDLMGSGSTLITRLGNYGSNDYVKLHQPVRYRVYTYNNDELITSTHLNSLGFSAGAYSVLRLQGSTKDYQLTGIPLPTTNLPSFILYIIVDDTSLTIHDDGLASIELTTPQFKIRTGEGGSSLTISGNGGVTLLYNTDAQRWFVIDWKQ